MSELHTGIPEVPLRCRKLPVVRGFPVPWFVQWMRPDGSPCKVAGDPEGFPDFRVVDSRKWAKAVRERRCWVCGDPLGANLAFVIGPMCAVNRVTSEPPLHRECAEWSVRACPFLSQPKAKRRDDRLPEGYIDPAGIHLDRNPGVMLIWVTRSYSVFPVPGEGAANGGYLIKVGEHQEVAFYCEGRAATAAEIMHSIDTGMPHLESAAQIDGPDAVAEVARRYAETKRLVHEVAA